MSSEVARACEPPPHELPASGLPPPDSLLAMLCALSTRARVESSPRRASQSSCPSCFPPSMRAAATRAAFEKRTEKVVGWTRKATQPHQLMRE